jgi:single-strand DNA-binding protein
MSSLNKVTLIGNVGNIEIKEYEKGGEKKPLVQVSLATSDGYKDKNGEWQNNTEWHKCVFAIPSLAERAKSIGKGDSIMVEGSIKTNKWTDKEGNEQSYKEIAVVSYKTWRKAKTEGAPQTDMGAPAPQPAAASPTGGGDDLPF